MIKLKYIFPLCLIIFNLAASIVCAVCGDWKKALYWLAAALLNATVTF